MFADKKSANYSIQQIGIYRKSTEKNFLFWYSNYTNTEVYMHTVYFICVIASIITVVFMHLFEEEDIFFAYIYVCHCQVKKGQ